MTMRRLIRADGTHMDLPGPVSMEAIAQLIGAHSLDTVQLRHLGHPVHMMVVDDLGIPKALPINAEATALYHANCKPGTTQPIRGDVVVVPDSDYEP